MEMKEGKVLKIGFSVEKRLNTYTSVWRIYTHQHPFGHILHLFYSIVNFLRFDKFCINTTSARVCVQQKPRQYTPIFYLNT